MELDNCPLITDVTLEHLKSCHRLERIELYDCQQVTRAGIKRIRVSGSICNCNFPRFYCLPNGSGSNREWPGWDESFTMVLALLRR